MDREYFMRLTSRDKGDVLRHWRILTVYEGKEVSDMVETIVLDIEATGRTDVMIDELSKL